MSDRPRLFTSSYRAALASDEALVVVRISIGKPKWLAPATADAMPFVSELAPFGAFHIEDAETFERVYRERLDRAGVGRIEARLCAIAEPRPGVPLALCCFEPGAADCHRSSWSRWWLEQTGEAVPERSGPT